MTEYLGGMAAAVLFGVIGWGLRGLWDRRGAPTVSEATRRDAINRRILAGDRW